MSNTHNKSGLEYIKVYYMSDEEAFYHHNTMENQVEQRDIIGCCIREDSRCWYVKSQKGRYTSPGSKNQTCFGYQLAARKKYGNQAIRAHKQSMRDMMISHLCGAPGSRCVNPDHLVIEEKKVNDERVHCHFFMNKIMKQWKNPTAKKHFVTNIKILLNDFVDKYCPHEPKCGSVSK